jgi:hypothetical protein
MVEVDMQTRIVRGNHARTARTTFALVALVSAIILSITLLGTTSAFAIARTTVLARAQVRVDKPVPYSQSKYYAGYRTDCSGYVSMCWATGSSYNTRSFYKVTHRIPVSSLQPGDAMLKKNYHIKLFYGWVDEAHTQYVAYEASNNIIAGTRIHSIAEDLDFGYIPVRYDRITGSAASRNLLQNGAFKVWAKSWGKNPDQPVWWQSTGSWWETVATPRTDTYRSSRRSLKLTNSSGDPSAFTELSQSADSDPRGLELKLTYLNAAGESVAETTTTGDSSGINSSSFRWMGVRMSSPADAVKAVVTVRLARGETIDASGTVLPGTSATLDDISLYRPYISASIIRSRTTAYNGTTAVVSGLVSPKSSIGATVTVYVQKPGAGWTKLATTRVYASGSSAKWRGKMTFSRSMRRGIYRFKATVVGIPGYVGTTTSIASIRLR